MKIEYDKEVDAAYIYIKYPIANGEASKSLAVNENIILDFNKEGKLIGVEVLSAEKILGKEVLQEKISIS
tara:strand:- start:1542 stop:1751 length:210 start_codon:yes stop_codon:yes gene_type:complete